MQPQNCFSIFLAVALLTFGSVSSAEDATDMADMSELADTSGVNVDVTTVNVNQADAATIARVLSGIGLMRAQAIVDYRRENGPFYAAEELTAIDGIGQITVERNRSRITTR